MSRKLKNTQISWIGEIPENWDVQRVKNAFYRKKEEAHQEEPIVLSLARAGVKIRDMTNNEGQIAESYYNYNPVVPGDLLLNPMDLYSGANCSVSKVEGVISPAYINLGAKPGYNSTYYDYFLKTQYWAMAMFAHGKGVSFDNRWTLGADDLMRYYIPVPPISEQDLISDFLETKCEKIDSVIEKTSKSIAEYKRLKREVISQVVNPTIKLETSEWQYRKLKSFIAMPVIDGPHESPELLDDGIPYISATAIENGKINFSLMRGYISEQYCEECEKRYKPQVDDILVIKLGASTGQVAIVETSDRFNIWVPLAAIRCNNQALPKFIYYAFQSNYLIEQMELSWTFGTQQTLGVKTIEKLRFWLPNVNTQKDVINSLDKKIGELDALIAKKELFLSELENYKKSLIYEYVTGKKEVPTA